MIAQTTTVQSAEPQIVVSAIRFVRRPDCRLCGSRSARTLIRRSFLEPTVWDFLERYYEGRIGPAELAAGYYQVNQCTHCGFLWQVEILDEVGMDALYSRWISPQQSLAKKTAAPVEHAARYAAEVELIARLLKRPPSQLYVLDFGMGWGHWCSMAKAFGYRVVGLELSSDRIAHARRQGIAVIQRLDDLPRECLDFINSEQVLEHVAEPRQALAALVRALRPGGIVHLGVPNGRGIARALARRGWKPAKDAIHPLEHINCFTPTTLAALGRSAGLELIDQPWMRPRSRSIRARVAAHLACRWPWFAGTSLYFCKSHSGRRHPAAA